MKILYRLDVLNEHIGRLVSWLIWIGAAILVYEVVMRYAMNSPTSWAHGYTQRIFGSYFILLGTFTLLRRGHVRIDLFLRAEGTRTRAVQDIFNYGMLLIWMLALAYEGWAFLQESILWEEVDESGLGHPLWPPKLMLFLGASLMAVQAVVEIIHSALVLLRLDAGVQRSISENEGVQT